MSASDILGKIGEKVGGEFSDLRVSLGTLYATKVSLGNVVNTIDFTPYATKVSLGETRTSIANLVDGTSVFSDLKATRAEIGDLIVNGTTTTLNTQTLSVEDNIIEVNLKSDGSETAQTGGLEINRGQASAYYNEAFGTNITNFSVTVNNGYALSFSWDNNGVAETYAVADTIPTGSETESHIGKVQAGANYSDASTPNSSLNFDFNSDGELTAIDTIVQTSGSGSSVTRIVGYTNVGGVEDKAKFIWDDSAGEFQTLLGSSATKLAVSEIKVPNSSGVKINNISLGDYSTFESAFNTANS
mgnify:CR=1 FL=1